MRTFARVVFGLNAVYQLLVAALCLAVPATVVELYGAPPEAGTAFLLATFRLLGGFILFGGVISAMVARDPDRNPVLLPLMGLLAVLTLLAWVVALTVGEVTFAQVAVDLVAQALLIAAVALYPRARARSGAVPTPERTTAGV